VKLTRVSGALLIQAATALFDLIAHNVFKGGGKDRVELFIERARKNVIDSRDSLATVIEILGINEKS